MPVPVNGKASTIAQCLLRSARFAGRRTSANSTRQAQRPRLTADLASTDSEARGRFARGRGGSGAHRVVAQRGQHDCDAQQAVVRLERRQVKSGLRGRLPPCAAAAVSARTAQQSAGCPSLCSAG